MSQATGRAADPITAESATAESAAELCERADLLISFAEAIERQGVMGLPDLAVQSTWNTGHAGLCERMLRRNLHQLRRCADELRSVAHRQRVRAGRLDRIAAA